MIVLLALGFVFLGAGAVLLLHPSPMLSLLDRGYFTRLSPLWRVRRQPAQLERYGMERKLLRFLLPLTAIAIGAVWVGFALTHI